MKRIMGMLAAVAVALCSAMGSSSAQTKDVSRPYNLEKAYEVLRQDRDEEKALQLLSEQLKSTPDNVECLMLMCRIYRNRDENGRAMSCVNEAIRVNRPRKSGFCTSSLYWWKASIYDDMAETEKEVDWLRKALDAARKDNRDNVQQISFSLGQALFELDRLGESDAVYTQMVSADETDQAAMAGLARNMIHRGEHEAAVRMLDACQRYGDDYAGTYKFRCEAYDRMGQTDRAIDDVLTWFEKDDDALGSSSLRILMKHRSYAVAKAQAKMRSSDRKDSWRILLLSIYEESGEYEKAIVEYDALEEEYGRDAFIYAHRADCYDELGMVDQALAQIEKAIELDDDYPNSCTRGGILRTAGRYEEAMESFDHAIGIDPSRAFAYYAKGWCHELMGDDDGALECYEQGIDISKDYAYIYLMRGQIFLKRGEVAKAEADFETVLQLDTMATDGSCRQYALHFLGRDDEADGWMQRIIDAEPYDRGHYYDRACLSSRMGRLDEAVQALGKALEMGYCKFAHIEHDDDLDAIRDRDDFREMISGYREKLSERIAVLGAGNEVEKEEQITEVPISRRTGGTFNVDCSVNGLALSMIFDTGASDVTISKVEADFMFKNDYLAKDDIKGRKYYQVADGGISEGTVVTLREVRIGDAVLHNVDASVVRSQKAPLLLGESVLRKFGTFTVDNINGKLIIKH